MTSPPPGADTASRSASDQDLSARLVRRDPSALAEIYDRHADRVHALGLRMLRSPSEAEDLAQDIFTALWQSPGSYDPGRGPLSAWLLMLTRSRAVDRIRARKARRDRGLEPAADAELPEVRDPGPGPEAEYQRSIRGRAVWEALRALPEPQRQAIEAAFFEGLSQSEVAEKTGAPLGTVKTRIRDGMRKMRSLLEGSSSLT